MMNALKSLVQWKGSIPQGGLLDFVLKVILALIVYFIGTKLIGWFCKKLRKQLMKFGSDEATKSFLLSGIKIGMHLILILTIAGNLGVDKTSVAALVGSAGVAISLALQGGLSNFAGGLIIMFLRPFSVGDYIIENGEKTEGTVQKIELYYTTLMTIDSRRIVIPNSVLTNDSITNVTAMEKRRLEIKVGISMNRSAPGKTDPPGTDREGSGTSGWEETQVFVDELGDSAVILGLRAWVKTEEFWNTKWRMNEQIKLEFDKRAFRFRTRRWMCICIIDRSALQILQSVKNVKRIEIAFFDKWYIIIQKY